MDKRSILFLITLSLAIFSIKMFFDYQHEERMREWYIQKEIYEREHAQQIQANATSRRISPLDLPLLNLTNTSSKTKSITKALRVGDSIITLFGNKEAPASLWHHDKEDPQEYQLILANESSSWPVLYGNSKGALLATANINPMSQVDLQMLTFSGGAPEIHLAVHKQGYFSFVLKPPKQDALALLKTDQGYLPAGFYDHKSEQFSLLTNLPGFKSVTKVHKPIKNNKFTAQNSSENYYVLENAYQQLVFSNIGGALVEINLPFPTKDGTNSIVREIENDRIIKETSPENAYFPLRPYYEADASGTLKKNETLTLGSYYPLLRRDVLDPHTKEWYTTKPNLYAMNLVSDYPEISELVYDLKEMSHKHIVFESVQQHRRITKIFRFPEAVDATPYLVEVDIQIERDHSDTRPLWLTTGVPEVELISGSATPSLQYRMTRLDKPEVKTISLPSDTTTLSTVQPDWVSNSNGFLGFVLDPMGQNTSGFRAQHIPGNTIPTRLIAIGHEYKQFDPVKFPAYNLLLPIPRKSRDLHYRFYAGPFSGTLLHQIDTALTDPTTGYTPDYISCKSYHGWFSFISAPFAKILFWMINFFHSLTQSWALSIILLTVSLRVLLYPLNAWSFRSMRRMQQVSPLVQKIQEKHKKDPAKAQQEVMALYKETGANPLTGCLPMLLQMPFLIGMFDLLKSTFELRGASFIPGWIDNLTAPDVAFDWGVPVFFVGTQLHILPLLLSGVMYLQQKISSNLPPDKSTWTEQQKQQKTMGTVMTIVFSVMFYHFPSGLNIYWLSSMLLGILQQWYNQRSADASPIVLPTKDKRKKLKKQKS